MSNSLIQVTEMPTFQTTVGDYLSENELNALRFLLANHPLAGSDVQDFPGILELDWRNDGSAIIRYLVASDFGEILLISVHSANESSPPTPDEISRIQKLLKKLGEVGFIVGVKEIIMKIIDSL